MAVRATVLLLFGAAVAGGAAVTGAGVRPSRPPRPPAWAATSTTFVARQSSSPPAPPRGEPLPFMRPAEIARLPPLERIYESPTRPGVLLAESTDGFTCTLTDEWPPGAPVDQAMVAGQSTDVAVAVIGDEVCSCFLPFDESSRVTSRCARIDAGRGGPNRFCFPAAARVALAGGAEARVDGLAVGAALRVGGAAGGAAVSSPLIAWTHHDAAAVTRFAVIAYELPAGDGGRANETVASQSPARTVRTLRASLGHYLYTATGDLVPAGAVAVGDTLAAADGSPARVTSVTTALGVGLYNPHPAAGELIVDGLRVSAYTTAVPPALAHAALAPVRAAAAAAAGVVDPLGRVGHALAAVGRLEGGVRSWWTTAVGAVGVAPGASTPAVAEL
ncbi:hypothetical protein BU14_0357s0012 [Porphyra umbilicalis]|uniref:Hedgehog protein Hint domain-containing protein n=1 Tax=Porphyra umbilicalis TaxID=2786 RepID=A0A1X6NXE1_PORUM|nr:hypothetical protein BU14_0357s0012 [Porphyra umbilicalis]|eukprot:OSX73319.1 hypothetical protein BU14_0357s0012 [Porphyra umbilicalis]